MRRGLSDIGEPGTARNYRMNLERARIRLTRRMAQRLAKGLFPEIADELAAEQRVFALYFATVKVHGTSEIKRFAGKLRRRLEVLKWSLPLWHSVRRETPATVEPIDTPSKPEDRAHA